MIINKTMKQRIYTLIFALIAICPFINASPEKVIVHSGGGNHGNDQMFIEPPYVTYDDDLKQLTVYFGTAGSIDLMYLDLSGTPEYYIYGENHYGGYTATYSSLPAGYYTITIHSVYGVTYTGNFTVS